MKEYIAFHSHRHYTLMEREELATGRVRQRRIRHKPGAIRNRGDLPTAVARSRRRTECLAPLESRTRTTTTTRTINQGRMGLPTIWDRALRQRRDAAFASAAPSCRRVVFWLSRSLEAPPPPPV